MRLTYDATTDVAYLALRATGPADILGPTLLVEHDHDFPGAVALDFGLLDGRVVGLEFQSASACLPAELLLTAERIDGGHLARVAQMRLGRRVQSSHGDRRSRLE
jgi:uncharacterized protein YuzE